MIQVSVAVAASPDRVTEALASANDWAGAITVAPHEAYPAGARITGVWPRGNLDSSFNALADVLAGLPPETPVTELFTGREETVASAVPRLRQRPLEVTELFSWRSFEWQGLLFWRLFGGYTFGRPDLIVEVENDLPLRAVEDLLAHLARYQCMSPRVLQPGDPMPYGHWLLSLASSTLYGEDFWAAAKMGLQTEALSTAFDDRMKTPAPLFVIEAREMVMGGDFDWVVGASRALRVLLAQRATIVRMQKVFELEHPPSFQPPFAQDPAVIGSDLPGSESIFAQRREPINEEDSGWHFGSADEVTEVRRELQVSTVSHLVERLPGLVRYLALPPGWAVTHDAQGYWISPPWSETGAWLDVEADPRPPWAPTPNEPPATGD